MDKKYIFVEYFHDRDKQLITHPIYEMPEEEFLKIAPANEKILQIYRFEELFAILVDNFFAFNNVILSYADKARLQTLCSATYFQKRIDVNRATLNFLATLNLYQEFLENNVEDVFDKKFWDSNTSFQRCLVMRNYIQHIEFYPIISNVSYTQCDLNVMLASVRFQLEASELKIEKLHKRTQEKFKQFFDMTEKIDLYEIINQGMEEIQLVQGKLRKMPLYTVDYAESKELLLDVQQKISPESSSALGHSLYFVSDGDKNDLNTCFLATDTIKFIDENIKRYRCSRSNSNQFITTAPKDFVDKCNNKIFTPAIDREWQRRTQEKMKGVPNA